MVRIVAVVLFAGLLLAASSSWAGGSEPATASPERAAPTGLLQLRSHALGLSPDPTLSTSPGLDLETSRALPSTTTAIPIAPPRPGASYVTVTICGPDGVSRTYTYAVGEEAKVLENIYGDLSGPGQLDRQRLQRLNPAPLPGRRP